MEFLDQVYKNVIPWLFKNRKLFERSIRLVILWLRLYISNTRLTELLYITIEARLLQSQDLRVGQVKEPCIGLTQENLIENSVHDCLPYILKAHSLC